MVSKLSNSLITRFTQIANHCSLTPTHPPACLFLTCSWLHLQTPSTAQLHYSSLCLLRRRMSVFECHILGLLYTTKKHQLRRLSFSRGVSHDRGRPQYR